MSHTVVFILVDAGRWDYLNPSDTPLLWAMAEHGISARRMKSISGFTQRGSLFTGAHPATTGNFTMYVLDDETSPYAFLRPYRLMLNIIQRSCNVAFRLSEQLPRRSGRLIRALTRRFLEHLRQSLRNRTSLGTAYMSPARIPLDLLWRFNVSEDRTLIFEPGALDVESIFDLLVHAGKTFRYLMFPIVNVHDDMVLREALTSVHEDHHLYLLQFSDSDSRVHVHGTNSQERHKVLGEIDRKMRVLKAAFEKHYDKVSWVIVGDHGMTDVTKTIDVIKAIKTPAAAKGLKHGRDYLLFLDSTMARIWRLSDKAARFVEQVFLEEPFSEHGSVVTPEVATKYRIPLPDKKYGDVVWWAHPGVLIYPDYFHDPGNKNKAMHGYDSNHADMKGFAIVCSDGLDEKQYDEVELVDICPTLCDLLGLAHTSSCEGHSMLLP